MEVVRENAKMSQTVLVKSIECNVESSVIVPDKNPDILKILQVDTTASVDKKIIKDGRLTVEGRVYADVIYLPDSEEVGVKSLPVVFDFSDFFDSALLSSGMHTVVSCDIEQAELNMINSRKITLRVTVGINAEVIADVDTEYISEVTADDVSYKSEEIEGYLTVADDNIEFIIREEAEISQNTICDIIKCDATVCDKEIRLSGTKAIVKGSVSACVLYRTGEGEIETANARFPFTEVFELGEELHDELPAASINIIEKSCKQCGEHNIQYEFLLRIDLLAKKKVFCNMISDCYFHGMKTVQEREDIHFESVNKIATVAKSVREIVTCGEHMPKIASVYNVVAKPRIISFEKTKNGLSVNASLEVSVLYLSENKENPICCLKSQIPVLHMIDGLDSKDVALTAECEHISYALTGGGDVEIRASVLFSGEEKCSRNQTVLTSLDKGEKEARNEIVIFFASGGEDVWDVAKRYSVSPEYIAELNEIDESMPIDKGRKLIIPV